MGRALAVENGVQPSAVPGPSPSDAGHGGALRVGSRWQGHSRVSRVFSQSSSNSAWGPAAAAPAHAGCRPAPGSGGSGPLCPAAGPVQPSARGQAFPASPLRGQRTHIPGGIAHAPVGTSLEVEKTDIETAASVRAGVPEGFLRRAPPPGAAAAGLWARVSLSGYFSKYTSAETWAGPSGEAGSDGALSHNVARVGP